VSYTSEIQNSFVTNLFILVRIEIRWKMKATVVSDAYSQFSAMER